MKMQQWPLKKATDLYSLYLQHVILFRKLTGVLS